MATPPMKSMSGEEISESQAKINEELSRFQAEMKSEMARAKMKLDVLISMLTENRKSKAEDQLQTTPSDGFTPPSSAEAENEALFEQNECEIVLPMMSLDLHLGSTICDVQSIEEQIEVNNCSGFDKMFVQTGACKVFAEMPNSVTTFQQSYMEYLIPNQPENQLSDEEEQHPLMKMDCLQVVCNLFDEMIPSFRAEVTINLNNISLFDPGGDRKYAMNPSRRVVPKLFGKDHETYDNGMEGVDWGKTVMKNGLDGVLEKMPHPNSKGAKAVPYEYVSVVLDASSLVDDKFQLVLPVESILQGVKSHVDVLEDSACNVLERVKLNPTNLKLLMEYHEMTFTDNVEQTLSDGVEKLPAIKMACLNVAHNLFDELSKQLSARQKNCFKGLGKWEPPMVGFKGDAIKMMHGGTSLFMFGPSISSWHLKDCDSINSSGIPGNSVVDLWVGKVLLCFDPGGNTFVLGTWSLRNTLSKSWDRYFDDKGVVANYLSSHDTSALKSTNGFLMKKTYTGRFDRFDVFLKKLLDYSKFALLFPIFSTQNDLHLYDLVMPSSLFIRRILWSVISIKDHDDTSQALSLFMQITFIIYYFYGVCENEFPCYWKLFSSYDVVFLILVVYSENAILLYILEDKDGFEGVEKRILAMMMIRSIKDDQIDRKCGLNKACKPLRHLLFLIALFTYRKLFWLSLIFAKTGDELAIKMVMLNRVFQSIEMASLHYLNRTIDMGDGKVLTTIYHSFELYLAAIVKCVVLVNLKEFVWDSGRDLYRICMLCNAESLVAIGKDHFGLRQAVGIAFSIARPLYFQLGFVTTPSKVILMNSAWLRIWKCLLDGRDAWVLWVSPKMESFIWNPGISFWFPCSCVTLPRSYYFVFYGHGVPNAYKKINIATILPSEAVLQWRILFHRSVSSGFVAVSLGKHCAQVCYA